MTDHLPDATKMVLSNPYRAMCDELFVKLKEWDMLDPFHDCGPLLCRARALLGHPTPQPPADGEVGEVIAVLRDIQDCFDIASGMEGCGPFVARAADLLERLASPDCLVINPSPEALAALKAAGPGIIEAMPANALPTPEDTNV